MLRAQGHRNAISWPPEPNTCSQTDIWGVSRIRGTFLEVPRIRIMYGGPPILRDYYVGFRV